MGKFHIYRHILQETRCFQEKFTQLEKSFYTTGGRDGRDKFQVCDIVLMLITMVEMVDNGDGGYIGKCWKGLESVGKCWKVVI